MSRANLMIASILFEMLKNGFPISIEERAPSDDRVAGLMVATAGPEAMILVGDLLGPLLEEQPTLTRSFSVQCSESAEAVWERMEAMGIPWQFYSKAMTGCEQLVSLFFLKGDKLCADAKKLLQESAAISNPPEKGARQ